MLSPKCFSMLRIVLFLIIFVVLVFDREVVTLARLYARKLLQRDQWFAHRWVNEPIGLVL